MKSMRLGASECSEIQIISHPSFVLERLGNEVLFFFSNMAPFQVNDQDSHANFTNYVRSFEIYARAAKGRLNATRWEVLLYNFVCFKGLNH